jgi:hypothetical protein
MPGARCARSLACKWKKHTSVITTVTPDSPGIPRAMDLQLISCSPRRPGLFATVARDVATANLTPASGRQDHTTSPSAKSAIRQRRRRVHRIPPRVDDVAQRPSVGQDGGSRRTDLPDGLSDIFFTRGLDSQFTDLPVGQIRRVARMQCNVHRVVSQAMPSS